MGVIRDLLLAGLRGTAYFTGFFAIAFSLLSLLAAHLFWRRKTRRGEGDPELPPITVLKPLKGLDHEMYENLASFMAQDYPAFQTIFCLQDPDDPALPVLKRLRQDFPEADMEIVVSRNPGGPNPKIGNLENAKPFIKHGLLLLSDSDIRAGVDCFRRLVTELGARPGTGLVTSFYECRQAQGLGAAMEFLSINAHFLPQALVAAMIFRMRFAMGAVILIPRDVFESTGGFANLSRHLADDYCLGKAVEALGRRVVFAPGMVASIPDTWSFRAHFSHLVRWSRTVRVCQPTGYLASFLMQGFALNCLNLLCARTSAFALCLTAGILLARLGSVAWLQLAYTRNLEVLAKLPLLPFSDIIQSLAWLAGFGSRRVVWRGREFKVEAGGRLEPA